MGTLSLNCSYFGTMLLSSHHFSDYSVLHAEFGAAVVTHDSSGVHPLESSLLLTNTPPPIWVSQAGPKLTV